MTGCYECGARSFRCAGCGTMVLVELIDCFHVGECPACGQWDDEPCPERTGPQPGPMCYRLRAWWRILVDSLGRLANPFGPCAR